jgi:anti-anti-sigma regulatory factor
MTLIRQEQGGQVRVRVEGPLSIYEVVALRNELVECLGLFEGVILELDQVTECDLAGVQLLYSARLAATARGKGFTVSGATEAVTGAVSRAGLDLEDCLGPGKEG